MRFEVPVTMRTKVTVLWDMEFVARWMVTDVSEELAGSLFRK
jgi:hypothetical protein